VKLLVASIFFLTAAGTAVAADKPLLNGPWKIHQNIAGNESDMDCSFTQKDSDLTGTCKSDQSTFSITGKVGDKEVTWQYATDYNGQSLTIVYTSPLPADSKIAGNVKVKEMDVDGDFKGTQTK
jgi:hypothetical protein